MDVRIFFTQSNSIYIENTFVLAGDSAYFLTEMSFGIFL